MTSYEPAGGWSSANLAATNGDAALEGFRQAYPTLPIVVYDSATLDLDRVLDGVDLALVHEWNEPALVARIGSYRRRNPDFRVLFHDTHHRSVTEPESMARYDLSGYDGVLAFGESVREQYERRSWAARVWTWHEAADTRVFRPLPREKTGDLVWIGNWGDDERTHELREFLIAPVRQAGITASIHGVRYPEFALAELAAAGIQYRGWLPNYLAPETFAQHRVTVHVPRRPYTEKLPGVPTIRVFEALACGIPLISAPWQDSEHLFPQGSYLTARNGPEMSGLLREVLHDSQLASQLAARGCEAIAQRHTCGHRVDELLSIFASIAPARSEAARSEAAA